MLPDDQHVRLQNQQFADEGGGATMPDAVAMGRPPRMATNLEVFAILGTRILSALTVLVIGVGAGYGLVAAVAHSTGQPLSPVSWARLSKPGPISVAIMFAMAGFLIEGLRFQGHPRDGRFFRAWAAAGPLRRRLFVVMGVTAIGAGLFAGL